MISYGLEFFGRLAKAGGLGLGCGGGGGECTIYCIPVCRGMSEFGKISCVQKYFSETNMCTGVPFSADCKDIRMNHNTIQY